MPATGPSDALRKSARPPPPLILDGDPLQSWKRWKKRWNNYALLSALSKEERQFQIAQIENCLGDDALRTLEGLKFPTAEDARTVAEIIDAFDTFVVGEVNQTLERFNFGKRQQAEGESFDKFVSDLRILMKTCDYCDNCCDSILRDRIILGIQSEEIRGDLLKERNLTLEKCIDICKAGESASTHKLALQPEVVHKVESSGSQRRTPQSRECKFCDYSHPMAKSKCPAYGKTCRTCGEKNHFASKCPSNAGAEQKHKKKPNKKQRRPKTRESKVHQVENAVPSDESDFEWCNSVVLENCNAMGTTTPRKMAKCRLTVNGQDVVFQIDTGATVNILPRQFAENIKPYDGVVKMWNKTRDKPLGICRMKVTNPRNRKKYSVPFLVFEDGRQPILSYQTSVQMKFVEVKEKNFEMVASMSVPNTFSDVVDGKMGQLPGTQQLRVNPEAIPVVMANRRVPIAQRPHLKEELDRLVSLGVITAVEEPTPWVSQIVLTPKDNGKLRVCIDPHELNKALIRERFTLPILDDVLHELREAKMLSKADLSSGYWHVKLDEASSLLTTFQTCFGRYRWLRLPFGLSVSSEIFQKKLLEAFTDLPGVICIADDIVIHGKSKEEHGENLRKFLSRCQELGIKLNSGKLKIGVDSVTFMGHLITTKGQRADPEKVKAIVDMKEPDGIEELRRFLGVVNYLNKFLPNVKQVMVPLHNLLKKEVPWNWSTAQQEAFNKVKGMITSTPVLAFYDPNKPLTVENDACEYGLGSAILQDGKPVAYASRSLSEAEKRYAQIEKEMLAVTFGLEKFHHYTYGRDVEVVTDHKPLVAIHAKPLSRAPKRLQNLLLRAQKYNYKLSFKPGKDIPLADALSRAPTAGPTKEEVEVNNVTLHPMKDERLNQIRNAMVTDTTLLALGEVIMKGWPDCKNDLPESLRAYFSYRDELTAQDGLILRGERVVIPASMRQEMKRKVHEGHLGINSCLRRARDVMFWPGMSADIRQHVETCGTCATYSVKQPQETKVMTSAPRRPWQRIASDLLSWGGYDYLVTVDYHSNFFEVDRLHDTTASTVISKLKSHFARYGIPDVLVSDNAAQFSCAAFKNFTKDWKFQHETISPGNSQANGAAEAAVKIVKRLMRKGKASGEDPFIGLLNARNTPTEGMDTSPAQRLLGRRTKTLLPTTELKLCPNTMMAERAAQQKEERRVRSLKKNGNDLRPLSTGDTVRIQPIQSGVKEWQEAKVTKQLTSRSYEVTNREGNTYRRNRRHLRKTTQSSHSVPSGTQSPGAPPPLDMPTTPRPESTTPPRPETTKNPPPTIQATPVQSPPSQTSSFGRAIKKPARYVD